MSLKQRANALRPSQSIHRPTGLACETVVARIVSNERASRHATASRRYPDGAKTIVDGRGHAAGEGRAMIVTGVDRPAVGGGIAREIRARNLIDVGMVRLNTHIEYHYDNVR